MAQANKICSKNQLLAEYPSSKVTTPWGSGAYPSAPIFSAAFKVKGAPHP
ncbi:MAG: hypothetical protein WCA84_16470 [Ignavibacteriaceae bacterium]